MFTTLVLVVHVVVCIALILIILLQTGKGADIGAAFGGGSTQTVFGSTGATSFLSRVTIGAAVIFMVTSFVLTYYSGKNAMLPEKSLLTEQSAVPAAPQSDTVPTPQPEAQKGGTAQQAPQPPAPAGSEKASTPAGAPVEKGPPEPK